MSKEVEEKLRESVSEILEQFAFMFTEDISAEDNLTGEILLGSIFFTGPQSGIIDIAAPESLCREMVGNTLGLDDESCIAIEDCENALKEIVNMVCGKFTEDMYGNEKAIDFSIPSVVRLDSGKWKEKVRWVYIPMEVEGHALCAALEIVS